MKLTVVCKLVHSLCHTDLDNRVRILCQVCLHQVLVGGHSLKTSTLSEIG